MVLVFQDSTCFARHVGFGHILAAAAIAIVVALAFWPKWVFRQQNAALESCAAFYIRFITYSIGFQPGLLRVLKPPASMKRYSELSNVFISIRST